MLAALACLERALRVNFFTRSTFIVDCMLYQCWNLGAHVIVGVCYSSRSIQRHFCASQSAIGLETSRRIMTAKVPDLNHLARADFEQVYEPSDDTYLFLDGILSECDYIKSVVNPKICVEIGTGSGCVIT